MDPNLFHVDYERLFEVLVTIVVLSFFIERALAVVFETRWFITIYEKPNENGNKKKRKGLKELIALVVSIAVCFFWKFDAFTIIVVARDKMQIPGYILTGLIIAGGSKASIKLFRDILGFMSSAEKERISVEQANNPTP